MSVAPLKLSWATPTHVRGTSSALDEPDWLLADRLAALEALAEPAGRAQPALHHLPGPARRGLRGRRAVPAHAGRGRPERRGAAGGCRGVRPRGRARPGQLRPLGAGSAGRPRHHARLAEAARERPELVRAHHRGRRLAAGGRCLRAGRPRVLVAGRLHPRAGRRDASSSPSCCAGAAARRASGSSAAPW